MFRTNRFKLLWAYAAAIVALGLPANCATADILVSNLSSPYRSSTPIGNPEFWGGQSFLFATPDPVYLSSIEAIVGNGSGAPEVVAELRSSIGPDFEIDNTPAGLLATFAAPDMSGPAGIRSFAPNASVMLMPNTVYWFTLGSANAGTFDWDYADDSVTTGFGVMGNYADSSDAGATWILRDSTFPYFMQVNTSAIPEPTGGLVLTCIAGAMAAGFRVSRSYTSPQSRR